jgi:TonB family protein
VPPVVTLRVVVSATGEPTRVQVTDPAGQAADPRLAGAVRRAVQACEWIPGADAQGNRTAQSVVQPIRFGR